MVYVIDVLLIALLTLIVFVIVLALTGRIIKKILPTIQRSIQIREDTLVQSTKYSEDEIIKHLDYIITEALDEYVLLELTPKNIYYINNKLETAIVTHLSTEVPKRISKTLYTHLSFIYNNDYLGEYIGRRIYITVFNYVINFNVENEGKNSGEKMAGAKKVNIANEL
jgi:hypothetical protein